MIASGGQIRFTQDAVDMVQLLSKFIFSAGQAGAAGASGGAPGAAPN